MRRAFRLSRSLMPPQIPISPVPASRHSARTGQRAQSVLAVDVAPAEGKNASVPKPLQRARECHAGGSRRAAKTPATSVRSSSEDTGANDIIVILQVPCVPSGASQLSFEGKGIRAR